MQMTFFLLRQDVHYNSPRIIIHHRLKNIIHVNKSSVSGHLHFPNPLTPYEILYNYKDEVHLLRFKAQLKNHL